MDWNLLVALDVLLAEGSVTGAAERLHLSVPATSRTLSRIRAAVGDPVLVRAGRGLVPTPRALAMQARLHQLVEDAHALVRADRDVDLSSLERTFVIRANESLSGRLAVDLLALARHEAPAIGLRFVAEGEEDVAPLRDGSVDLDVGVISDFGAEVRTQPLRQDRLVGLVRSDHELASGRVTLRRVATADHVGVSRRGRRRGRFDEILERRGLARRVAVVVPTFTAAADIVTDSALTGFVPAGFATRVAASTGAHVYEIPARMPPLPVSQAWHVRHDLDPAHRWLRERVAGILGT